MTLKKPSYLLSPTGSDWPCKRHGDWLHAISPSSMTSRRLLRVTQTMLMQMQRKHLTCSQQAMHLTMGTIPRTNNHHHRAREVLFRAGRHQPSGGGKLNILYYNARSVIPKIDELRIIAFITKSLRYRNH